MKKFQKATRSVVPDSPEYRAIRNNIYADLREKSRLDSEDLRQRTGSSLNIEVKVNVGSFFNLLIVNAEDVDSFEVINILTYFGFPHNVEEDNTIT